MRRTAFSMCAITLAVISGTAIAQQQPMDQPTNAPQPVDPSRVQPNRPGTDRPGMERQPGDKQIDAAEHERMQKEWEGLKAEWDKLTPEQQILSVLQVKNAHEIQMGQLGVDKGSTAAVRDFGALMVRDHRANNERLRSLAASENVMLWDQTRTERGLKLMKMFDKDAKHDKNWDKDRRDPTTGAPMPGGQPGTNQPGTTNPRQPGTPAQPGMDNRDMDKSKDGRMHEDPMVKLRKLSGDEFDQAFAYHMHKGHTMLLEKLEKMSPQLTNASVKTFATETATAVRQHKDQAAKLPGAMDWKDKDAKDGKDGKEWKDKDSMPSNRPSTNPGNNPGNNPGSNPGTNPGTNPAMPSPR